MLKGRRGKRILFASSLLGILMVGFLWVPVPTFQKPYSTVLEDRNGFLLGASIAKDGQWRFPKDDTIPIKFEKAILCFEDKHFYRHPGFNPFSYARALYKNLKAGKIVQGGSTLTMQTVRLSRNNPPRSFLEKLWELLLSIRLEIKHSKKEILALYAGHAPFGGNVVGIEAAAWRYFGRSTAELSWGEACLLAVLPNSPSLIYPGKNHALLLKKRNKLIDKLFEEGAMDATSCKLAKLEPLPQAPKPLPRHAIHFLDKCISEGYEGQLIKSTLDLGKQIETSSLLEHYHQKLASNSIHNGAILVLEVATGKVVAYVGNTAGNDPHHGHEVDIITSKRSYGSLLKPLLYAAMLEEGSLLPRMLVPDIPTNIAGYQPQNFFKDYDGAVPAHEVLSRSLNVPSVRLLHQFGVPKFLDLVQKSGITSLTQPAQHYGLSLILGGGEATLWDLTGVYSSIARTVKLSKRSFSAPVMIDDSLLKPYQYQPHLSAASLYFTLEAIAESKRPGNEGQWLQFPSSQKIYWKTGTSYGSRDAWSIGLSSTYAVGVWLGNASGEGRAGLTGVGTAAPLMFDVFNLLKKAKPLPIPGEGLKQYAICQKSGYKASKYCVETQEELIPASAKNSPYCPYHLLVHLNATGTKRVSSQCERVSNMQHKPWFVLPALQEWYYKPKHPHYVPLPLWEKGCETHSKENNDLELIYPRRFAKIYIPKEITGQRGMTVFEAAHRKPESTLYWHLDDTFVGETRQFHHLSLQVKEGWHTLTLLDEKGESLVVKFEVIGQETNKKQETMLDGSRN